MNELFGFLYRNSKWFVFALYLVLGLLLLFNGNPYQHHLWLTSASRGVAAVYSTGNNVSSYFALRDINEDLNRRNASLQAEVNHLQEQLQHAREQAFTDTMVLADTMRHFQYIVAHVINNSVSHPFNYLTINKGTADGVFPEFGVIDQNGVVGIVSVAGEHNSRVISLLNPNFRLSCKIKRSDNFGSLVWDGNNPSVALLEELPRHTVYTAGDTVVTSGYSAVFPPGLPVGEIIDDDIDHNQNFFTLRIRLFADFATLSNVQVVINSQRQELMELERSDNPDTDTKNKK